MERKLSAILAADIVGYSAQMERDEAGTFARLSERRKDIFEPEIARHGGRIFKTMGDGILAEFGSVVQAVECAVVLQSALKERNRDVPEDQAIQARIGINLGEVIVDGDDRYGEGVNIAARLEQLAEAGGICVSDKVAREVEKKLAFGFQAMGPQRVKNIAEPVMAFRVTSGAARPAQRHARRRIPVQVLALAAMVLAILAFVFWRTPPSSAPQLPIALAILPLENATGNAEQSYLSTVVPQVIAVVIGSSADVRFVIVALDSVVTGETDFKALAAELGVDLILAGQVGTAAGRLTFEGRVIAGKTGAEVARITSDAPVNQPMAFPFMVASETLAAVGAAAGREPVSGPDRRWAETTATSEEWALFLRASQIADGRAFSRYSEAIELLDAGIARNPASVLLRALKAELMLIRLPDLPGADRWPEAVAAWQALQGLPEPEDLPSFERWYLHLVRALLGPVATGDFAASVRDAEAAHSLSPGLPAAHVRLSNVAANAGRGDLAVAWARVGLTVERLPSDWQRDAIAWALLADGRPEEALAEFAQIDGPHCLPCEVVALVRTGRMDEARRFADTIRSEMPHLTIAHERHWPTGRQPFMAEPYLAAYLDDLRKAGLPETAPP